MVKAHKRVPVLHKPLPVCTDLAARQSCSIGILFRPFSASCRLCPQMPNKIVHHTQEWRTIRADKQRQDSRPCPKTDPPTSQTDPYVTSRAIRLLRGVRDRGDAILLQQMRHVCALGIVRTISIDIPGHCKNPILNRIGSTPWAQAFFMAVDFHNQHSLCELIHNMRLL